MPFDREMMAALEADGEKLRQMTGKDHGPWFIEESDPYPGYGPCPHCFESCGYVVEHGNDWNSGPYSHQTNIPCPVCHGTGEVEASPVTLDDLDEEEAQS
jgi:hypothetical protein